MGDDLGAAHAGLTRLRNALTEHGLVNLTGPLGSGKSRLLAGLEPDVLVDMTVPGAPARLRAALARPVLVIAVDGFDGAAAFGHLRRILAADRRSGAGRLVLASRLPVAGRRGWDGPAPATVQTGTWPDREVAALAARHGLRGGGDLDVVVRLSGGNPLLAASLTAAVHRGVPLTPPSAIADHAAEEILFRLRDERRGASWQRILRVLAGVGFGNEELLDVDDDEFTAVAGLSIVVRAGLGLAVEEPYRTILDLSYRWRRPLEHRDALANASVYRIRMLSETSDHELRRDLALHGFFLSDEPYVRAMLFPPRPALPPVTRAVDADADDLGRLVRTWATTGELDVRATDRLAQEWLGRSPEHFHVTRNADGRPEALAHLVPFGDAVAGGVEPVAQEFTERFVTENRDGTFVITGFWPDETAGAALLRRILHEGVDRGHIVVCTPKPEYQRLARRMGFTHFGTTRHATFGASHSTHVFGHPATPGDLPDWLARITALAGRHQPADYLTDLLVRELEALRTAARPSRSPLLAAPHTTDPLELRQWLTTAVDDLIHGERQADAEAGRILHHYYLGGATDHVAVATRLRMSRATYRRRLAHGLTTLTDDFRKAGFALLGQEHIAAAPDAAEGKPDPAAARTVGELTTRLRAMRVWAGNPSFSTIASRVARQRAARGVPANESRPPRTTIYDCFRVGRHRLDMDLLADIVRALGGTEADARHWRHHYATVTASPRERAGE